jgi:hypothetical protein
MKKLGVEKDNNTRLGETQTGATILRQLHKVNKK